jgi:hypothetical protein
LKGRKKKKSSESSRFEYWQEFCSSCCMFLHLCDANPGRDSSAPSACDVNHVFLPPPLCATPGIVKSHAQSSSPHTSLVLSHTPHTHRGASRHHEKTAGGEGENERQW